MAIKTDKILTSPVLRRCYAEAENGDIRCLYWLGCLFAFSDWTIRRPKFAWKMFVSAARLGHVPSFYAMIELWPSFKGRTKALIQERDDAAACMQAAADGGSAAAHVALAIAQREGFLDIEFHDFFGHVCKAAALHDGFAEFNVGCMLYFGVGVDRNVDKALGYWYSATERGCQDAAFYMKCAIEAGECRDNDLFPDCMAGYYEKQAGHIRQRRLPIWGRWLVRYNGEVIRLDRVVIDGRPVGLRGLKAFVSGRGLDEILSSPQIPAVRRSGMVVDMPIAMPGRHALSFYPSDSLDEQDANWRCVENIRTSIGSMTGDEAWRIVFDAKGCGDASVFDFLSIARTYEDYRLLMEVVAKAAKKAAAEGSYDHRAEELLWTLADYRFSILKSYGSAKKSYLALCEHEFRYGPNCLRSRDALVSRLWNAIEKSKSGFDSTVWIVSVFSRAENAKIGESFHDCISEMLKWGGALGVRFGRSLFPYKETAYRMRIPERIKWDRSMPTAETFYDVSDELSSADQRLKDIVLRMHGDAGMGCDTREHWVAVLMTAFLVERDCPGLEVEVCADSRMGKMASYDMLIPEIEVAFRIKGGPMDEKGCAAMLELDRKRNAAYRWIAENWGDVVAVEWGSPADMCANIVALLRGDLRYNRFLEDCKKRVADVYDLLNDALNL